MSGKIKINSERCKGCGLCITVCPRQALAISRDSNTLGHFPAEVISAECTGCSLCALICPDVAIEVYRQTGENDNQPAGSAETRGTSGESESKAV